MSITEFEPHARRAKRLRELCEDALRDHRERHGEMCEGSREVHIAAALMGYLRGPIVPPPTMRESILEEARMAVAMSAWKHAGDDAHSQGMDAGARHQVQASLDALDALPKVGPPRAVTADVALGSPSLRMAGVVTRTELVACARRIVKMVDHVTRSDSSARRGSSYLMLRDYIELAEGSAAGDSGPSTARPEGTSK